MLAAGIAFGSMSVLAAVDVRGDIRSAEIVAHQAPVSEVLSAIGATLNVRFNTSTVAEAIINGTYRGALEDVLARVLRGYNYVITTREGAIEVTVIGRSDELPVAGPPVQTALPPNTNPAAQWRASTPPMPKP